ncbi:MAG TPA: ABC transporter permease [Trueperaceae bacterium]|jgi:ABC-type dipeptide/oligopeptide/nickel transport system permease component|nr:ABC transporter permease [Trueperaceae bacterium]HRP47546.1 ABC transporter permease [Trueperaceae bacterium]
MTLFIIRRLAALVPVLLGVTLLVFAMLWLAPGDPVLALLGESAQGISRAALEELRRAHGFDRGPVIQYLDYLGGLVRGDLGTSVRSGQPVMQEVLGRFPATLLLAGSAMFVASVLGLTLGVLAAVFRRTVVDHVAVLIALLGVSVPVFWSGLLLMLLFALDLGWLPASGYGTWKHLVLPASAVGFSSAAFIARITRASMIETLRQDYVRTATAKGLGPGAVRLRHALRNALLPVVTVVGLQFGGLLGGAVLTETVFAWPGIGRMLVDAIATRDLPLVQGSVLFIAVLFIIVNLAVDVSYAVLNPKVRYD